MQVIYIRAEVRRTRPGTKHRPIVTCFEVAPADTHGKMSQTEMQITHSVPLTATESHQLGPLLEIPLTDHFTPWKGCAGTHRGVRGCLVLFATELFF